MAICFAIESGGRGRRRARARQHTPLQPQVKHDLVQFNQRCGWNTRVEWSATPTAASQSRFLFNIIAGPTLTAYV